MTVKPHEYTIVDIRLSVAYLAQNLKHGHKIIDVPSNTETEFYWSLTLQSVDSHGRPHNIRIGPIASITLNDRHWDFIDPIDDLPKQYSLFE